MYEFSQEATALETQMVVRVALHRGLQEGEEKELGARMNKLPPGGQIDLSVPQPENPDRHVVCTVRVGRGTLAPPDRKGKSALTPLLFYGIVVTEQQASAEQDELSEGKLLTNIPTPSFAEALVLIGHYRLRWPVGVSREGSLPPSVQVRPRPRDAGLVAREAPGRESQPVTPSDLGETHQNLKKIAGGA
jgi:hypothetical protein